jgi:hypothetical protein
MSAEIIQLAEVRARRFNVQLVDRAPVEALETGARFHFWTGASGKRYVHTVYSLFDCPAVAAANYVLVKRSNQARRTVLAIGRLQNESASLNLAEIRQRGANLGADEVHIHLLATTSTEAQAVEVDLRTAQFASLSH